MLNGDHSRLSSAVGNGFNADNRYLWQLPSLFGDI